LEIKLTSDEVRFLVWECDVETEEGENRRWSRSNSTVVEKDGKFYSVYWEQGLTEMQDNDYPAQTATEVEQIEETVIIKKWVNKE